MIGNCITNGGDQSLVGVVSMKFFRAAPQTCPKTVTHSSLSNGKKFYVFTLWSPRWTGRQAIDTRRLDGKIKRTVRTTIPGKNPPPTLLVQVNVRKFQYLCHAGIIGPQRSKSIRRLWLNLNRKDEAHFPVLAAIPVRSPYRASTDQQQPKTQGCGCAQPGGQLRAQPRNPEPGPGPE